MSPRRAHALFALVCLLFSTTWLAIRIGLADLPPIGAAGLRFLVAFPILLAIARWKRLSLPRAREDWALALQLGLTMFAIPFALIYYAEQTVPSGLAAVLFAAHAIFVALLAHFVLHDEPLTTARVLGIAVCLAGLIIVFHDRMHGAGSWQGEAALVLTAAIQSTSSIAIRRARGRVPAVTLSCIGAGVGAVVLLGASAALGEPLLERMTPKGAASILYLAIFGSVIAFTLTIRLIEILGANRLAMTVYITPVAALVWGWMILGEKLGPGVGLGAACIVGGVRLAGRAPGPAAATASPSSAGAR
jgi:drug/metabolite transporter (DMT)-like permease